MNTEDTERISLLDSLERKWIKLPLAVMRDAGPAVQTLGGLLAISNRQTFASVGNIAERARLPIATVRKHLRTLDAHGWIRHKGRQETRAGRLRRTATIVITKRTRDAAEPYGVLPWWSCCFIRRVGRLTWGTRAVLSIIMARLMAMKKTVEEEEGNGFSADDFFGTLDNMGGEDRFRFSLRSLERQTGLGPKAIVEAKRQLNRHGLIDWSGDRDETGVYPADILLPSRTFRVVVTPTSEGMCHLSFEG